ncbi:SPOR domain-containing protein [Acaryochloris sp. IP29b_bin.148]|uniref:SPOR domain-containing protein n=1 Tax=Acaryochloris sp. IP29b_bin.148 TaxID=2969218 RepID=UPI00262B7283|nr:SPOR domain-containing protein [Acaryochloris sp. IP29b_bin.148]
MTIEEELALFRHAQTLATRPEMEASDVEESDPQYLPQATTADPASSAAEIIASDPPLPADKADLTSMNSVDSTDIFSPSPLELSEEIAEDLTPSELALFQVDTASTPPEEGEGNALEQQEAVLESTSFDSGQAVAGAPLPSDSVEENAQVSPLDPAIEDYLDSSTALRQHLEDSTAETKAAPTPDKFTAKRLALLLGVSILGALLIALLINVTGLSKKLWPPKQPQPKPSQPSDQSSDSTDQSQLTPSPVATPSTVSTEIAATQGPDLSKQEFSDVTLGNLSRLRPSPSPQPSAALPSPVASPQPSAAPPRPAASPQPSTAPQSAPILKNQASQTGLFYVVLPYNNASSLQQAQKLVPTAFLTNGTGGQQVQVGALATLAAAQRLAKQLRVQGLSAAIIAPN